MKELAVLALERLHPGIVLGIVEALGNGVRAGDRRKTRERRECRGGTADKATARMRGKQFRHECSLIGEGRWSRPGRQRRTALEITLALNETRYFRSRTGSCQCPPDHHGMPGIAKKRHAAAFAEFRGNLPPGRHPARLSHR